MKKIEARFRFKISLTTENIERVLEDRLLKKNVPGKKEISSVYKANAGVLQGDRTTLRIPCKNCLIVPPESFEKVYPFFPYHCRLRSGYCKIPQKRRGSG